MNIELTLKVQDLNARYVQAIDDNKLEAWPDFFTENGRYRVTTAENVERGLPLGMIYATSRAMLRDRVRSLRDANVYEAQRYRHVIGAPLIDPLPHPPPHSASEDARERAYAGEGRVGAVHAQTSFIVARIMHTGETTLFATGRYHDRIVPEDGAPRFAEKLVILDSRLIDTLLAIPL
jgi:3-phenylpropionate/cinnamic acid dioxygenase small subunit